jgi:hypothetical protein
MSTRELVGLSVGHFPIGAAQPLLQRMLFREGCISDRFHLLGDTPKQDLEVKPGDGGALPIGYAKEQTAHRPSFPVNP